MTTVTGKLLYQGQPGTSAAAIISPSNVTVQIDAATVCNTTGGAETITIYVLEVAGAVSAEHAIYSALSIPGGTTVSLSALLNHRVPSGGEVEVEASAGSALTLTISGREVSA